MLFESLLQAAPQGQGSLLMSVLPFMLIIVIFYFFIIRPQSKKQKETQKMIDALKKGDKIVTIGGIHGVISSVKEKSVVIKVEEGKLEINRSAVATVLNADAEKAAVKAPKKSEKSESKEEAAVEAKAEAAPAAEKTESAEEKPAETAPEASN